MRNALKILALTFFISILAVPAVAATAWDESADGDLSTEPNSPTPLSFATGSNIVSGSVISSTDIRDYMTFTISAGKALTNLTLLQYIDVSSNNPGNTGFNAIISGATSLIPNAGNVGSFLGSNHLTPPAGVDLLPGLASAATGGSGFTIPLGPGTYTYHVQQTSNLLTGYSLDFVVVPEPTSLLLASLGLAGLVVRRRN